jgi:Cu/Ag efflux protein CusF
LNRISIVLMSLVLVVFFAAASHPASLKSRQITGDVTAIDTKSNTITVNKKNRDVVVKVGEKTSIIQCTPKTSITDILIGDKVTAKYSETEVENKGRSITIKK